LRESLVGIDRADLAREVRALEEAPRISDHRLHEIDRQQLDVTRRRMARYDGTQRDLAIIASELQLLQSFAHLIRERAISAPNIEDVVEDMDALLPLLE
jgi:hypothetical protein